MLRLPMSPVYDAILYRSLRLSDTPGSFPFVVTAYGIQTATALASEASTLVVSS